MTKRMLIDATHAEETRVVVLNGSRLDEFDVETSTKRQLKGNIYLAKVVRVEPSLQAAFVDYGGNRHGFLAFNEIHPDYYQLPVADRERLRAEQEALNRVSVDAVEAEEGVAEGNGRADGEGDEPEEAETLGGDDAEEVEHRRPRLLRNYKIQEVVKHRQILLVQVVKEERGTKGAALTTYLSLAGRYCVLMPNTARGGGVSRKITSAADRKRLKSIIDELQVPEGMAVIVRTAGSERTKPEVKRDCEYLLRAWDAVRELTLKSTAPALVYEEANLIKRSIRDLYARDIDEVLVDGEEGYRLAKDFMRQLIPSHAKRVQLYKDATMPMLHRFQVEAQLDAIHSPSVQLRSGGYIVFNQTEALVAIDVNSGRSTRERHIEETALKTNLEAADEVARQLRLRDLAGLIVIDFIDMEESRNNHAVERRLKEAMRNDRARLQLGRISTFGLLELSRQRLRPSLIESSFQPCPYCNATGMVRSIESSAVHVLRMIEEEGIRHRARQITVHVHTDVALYLLNQKRAALAEIEARYGFNVLLAGDNSLIPPAHRIERTQPLTAAESAAARPAIAAGGPPAVVEEEDEVDSEVEDVVEASEAHRSDVHGEGHDGEVRRRSRRRRRRGHREENGPAREALPSPQESPLGSGEAEGEGADDVPEVAGVQAEADESDGQARRRRRGRRGGRRRARRPDGSVEPLLPPQPGGEPSTAEGQVNEELASTPIVETIPDLPAIVEVPVDETVAAREANVPSKLARVRRRKPVEPAPAEETATVRKPRVRARRTKVEAPDEPATAEAAPAPVAASSDPAVAPALPEPEPELVAAEPVPDPVPAGPPRRGWWNRLIS